MTLLNNFLPTAAKSGELCVWNQAWKPHMAVAAKVHPPVYLKC